MIAARFLESKDFRGKESGKGKPLKNHNIIRISPFVWQFKEIDIDVGCAF